MELTFLTIWGCMGYASKGERFVGELMGTIGTMQCFKIVEIGSFMSNVMYLEKKECKEL
jgi:hypothetical protein